MVVREAKFKKSGKLHSEGKIELFYKSVVYLLVGMCVLLAATGGVSKKVPGDTITPAEAVAPL